MAVSRIRPGRRWGAAALAVATLLALPGAPVQAAPASKPATLDKTQIVAVVNGDVISNVDVNNRARLFVMSTGLPMSQQVLDRLKPQIVRQLVDERLRMQEVERRKIVVSDKQIAAAIGEIEARNGMAKGQLMERLKRAGISPLTLIDQIRTQLGWTLVLRQELGPRAQITDAQVAERQQALKQNFGKPEYRVAEIFIPVDNPSNSSDAEHFADTVIKELRAGARFALVAAQFSQSQSALSGGELGWVQPNQLDPDVAKLVAEMPVGAISNPVKVPGGLEIVALQGRREIGRDIDTVLSVRQVFLPFSSPLNPQNPTQQQRETLDKARHISTTVRGCAQMEEVAKKDNSPRPADPGEIQLSAVHPAAFQKMLASLPLGHPSQPLVTTQGIMVMTVCSREKKNLAQEDTKQIRHQILAERVEAASRQLQRSLHRKAHIDIRNSSGV